MDISVVVPTYRRAKMLKKCLGSFLRQKYPLENFEVIVVDDGGDEETKTLISEFEQEGLNLRYLRQRHKGPAAARNAGAMLSSSPIVGFVDDDCTVDEDWIRLMLEEHSKNSTIVAVGGLTLTKSSCMHVLISQFLSTCSITTEVGGREEIVFFPTCNVSFKRSIFEYHKFDEGFPLPGGEDLEFFWRLFKKGFRFVWRKDIIVIHHRKETIKSFVRQAYIYGRGNFLVQKFHKDHPLLKELKTGKRFWLATGINLAKIPRFSYLMGKRFFKTTYPRNFLDRAKVYLCLCLHKIFYITGNIKEFMRLHGDIPGKEDMEVPNLIILDITHRCNLKCQMCNIWMDDEKDIDREYIKKILREAKELGVSEIALSGGEPLLREDIFEIFEYAHNLHIKNLGVLTNGILIKKHFDKLRTYIEDNTISLVISFDSLKSSVHNYIRNSPSAWEDTLSALKMLSSLKNDISAVNFNVITIILNNNLEELLDLAHFIRYLGTNSLQFQPLLPNNMRMAERKNSPFWVKKERLSLLDEVIDKLIEFKRKNPVFVKNSERNLSLIKKYYRGTISYNDVECHSAKETYLLSNEGRFTTCFSVYGSIREQNLTDVVYSRDRKRAQERVKKCRWPCLLPCFCDV